MHKYVHVQKYAITEQNIFYLTVSSEFMQLLCFDLKSIYAI